MSNEVSDWVSNLFELNPTESITSEAAEKTYKNDLFKDVLPALDNCDIYYYRNLTEAQQKDIAIWPLTRWMSSITRGTADQLFTVNEIVNKNSVIFSSKKSANSLESNKHKELQWMLLAITGTGKKEMHKWPGAPKVAAKSGIRAELSEFFPSLNDEELELLLKINPRQELELFFKDNGYDAKAIKDLFK